MPVAVNMVQFLTDGIFIQIAGQGLLSPAMVFFRAKDEDKRPLIAIN